MEYKSNELGTSFKILDEVNDAGFEEPIVWPVVSPYEGKRNYVQNTNETGPVTQEMWEATLPKMVDLYIAKAQADMDFEKTIERWEKTRPYVSHEESGSYFKVVKVLKLIAIENILSSLTSDLTLQEPNGQTRLAYRTDNGYAIGLEWSIGFVWIPIQNYIMELIRGEFIWSVNISKEDFFKQELKRWTSLNKYLSQLDFHIEDWLSLQ